MKIILICLFVIQSFVLAQWRQNYIDNESTLLDIQFVTDHIGYISNDQGKIYKTFNKGVDWIQQYSLSDEFINSISFVDKDNGWALGMNTGLLLRLSKEGPYWYNQKDNIGENLLDIEFIDVKNGWIVGFEGQIYRTSDGGNKWIKQISNITKNLWSVFFINENIGFAAGDGVILKTTTSGDNWVLSHQTESNEVFRDIYFVDEFNGWAVGQDWESGDALILYTNDGGISWAIQNSGLNGFRFQSVYFVDSLSGYICGGEGTILSTINGGRNWNIEFNETDDFLRSVFAIDTQNVFAVGQQGQIVSNGKNLKFSMEWDRQTAKFEVGSIQQFEWINIGVDRVNLEYTTDGGKNWIMIERNYSAEIGSYNWLVPHTPSIYCRVRISDSATNQIYSIMPSDNEIFCAPNNLDMMRFTENWFFTIYAENQWEIKSTPTYKNLKDIKFNNNNDGIAWGKNVLITTTDGGNSWVLKSEFDSDGASFINNSVGWIFNSHHNGTDSTAILKTLDGGISWELQYYFKTKVGNDMPNETRFINNIQFIDEKNGWIVYNFYHDEPYGSYRVHDNIIYKTTDGGYSWEVKNDENLDFKIFDSSLNMLDANVGWMKGQYSSEWINDIQRRSLFFTDDGGTTWNQSSGNYYSNDVSATYHSGNLLICQIEGSEQCMLNGRIMNNVKLYQASYIIPINIYLVSDQNGWLFGELNENQYPYSVSNRFICKTKDGGLSWNLSHFDQSQNLPKINKFFALNENNCWAAADSGMIVKLNDPAVSVSFDKRNDITDNYILEQNYPNPFNPVTTINFSVPFSVISNPQRGERSLSNSVKISPFGRNDNVSLKVYDVLGREVKTLVNESKQAGRHSVSFDASSLSSGVYYYQLKAGEFIETKKMVLMK